MDLPYYQFNGFEMSDRDIALVGTNRNGDPVTTIIDPLFKGAALRHWREDGLIPHGFIRRKA